MIWLFSFCYLDVIIFLKIGCGANLDAAGISPLLPYTIKNNYLIMIIIQVVHCITLFPHFILVVKIQ